MIESATLGTCRPVCQRSERHGKTSGIKHFFFFTVNMIMQGRAQNLHQVNIQWSMRHCQVNSFNKQNGHVISETYCQFAIPTVPLHLLPQGAMEVEIGA